MMLSERSMLNLFTELTPGGSEFANDPKRCVDYAKDRMRKQWEMILSRQRRINELQAVVAERDKRIAELTEQLARLEGEPTETDMTE